MSFSSSAASCPRPRSPAHRPGRPENRTGRRPRRPDRGSSARHRDRWREAPLAGGVLRPTRRRARRSRPGRRRRRAARCGRRSRRPRRRSRRRHLRSTGSASSRRRARPRVVGGLGLERRRRIRARRRLDGSASSRRRIRVRASLGPDSASSRRRIRFRRRRGRRRRSSTPPRAHRRPPGWFASGLGFVDVVKFVLPDDRDLAGQLGDGDGVGVAAAPPAPAADRRGTDRAVLRQQLRDRDRSGAAVAVVWSCHRVLPLTRCLIAPVRLVLSLSIRARTSPPRRFRRLRCRVSAESALLATPRGRCPRVSIRQRSHTRLRHQRARHDLWRPLGTHSFQFRTVSRGHPRDESYELPEAGSCQRPLHPRSRARRAPRR